MDMAVTVLPQPDSPTSPRVSPGARSKLTPATALTLPRSPAKFTVRSCTSSNGAAAGLAGVLYNLARLIFETHVRNVE